MIELLGQSSRNDSHPHLLISIQDKAREIESITARVIEIEASQWESLEAKDRCRVAP